MTKAGEVFEKTMQRRRDSAHAHWERSQKGWVPRPMDPTRCVLCKKQEELLPIYGKTLPGACVDCWPEARLAVVKFVAAWRKGITAQEDQRADRTEEDRTRPQTREMSIL